MKILHNAFNTQPSPLTLMANVCWLISDPLRVTAINDVTGFPTILGVFAAGISVWWMDSTLFVVTYNHSLTRTPASNKVSTSVFPSRYPKLTHCLEFWLWEYFTGSKVNIIKFDEVVILVVSLVWLLMLPRHRWDESVLIFQAE